MMVGYRGNMTGEYRGQGMDGQQPEFGPGQQRPLRTVIKI